MKRFKVITACVLMAFAIAACSDENTESTLTQENIFDAETSATTVEETEETEVPETEVVETTVEETDPEETEAPAPMTVGQGDVSVLLINDTGMDITSLSTGDDNLLDDYLWVDGDSIILLSDDSDVLNIVFADEHEDKIHNFNASVSAEITLKQNEDTLFIKYVNVEGDTEDTYDSEYEIDHYVAQPAYNPDEGCVGDEGLFY